MSEQNTEANAGQTEVEQASTATKAVETEKPAVKEKTLTEKEHIGIVAKIQSTFESKAAVERAKAEEAIKEAERAADRASRLEQRLAAIEAEKDREWEESVGGTPEGQTLIAARKRLKAQEEAIAERERQAQEKYKAGEFGLRSANAMEYATMYGVDYKLLLSEKSPEGMKARALEIALENERAKKTEPVKAVEPEEKETESITPDHIDSGVMSTRSSKARTKDKLNEQFAHGEIEFEEYQEEMNKLGG